MAGAPLWRGFVQVLTQGFPFGVTRADAKRANGAGLLTTEAHPRDHRLQEPREDRRGPPLCAPEQEAVWPVMGAEYEAARALIYGPDDVDL